MKNTALSQHDFNPHLFSITATGATKNLRRFGQSIKRVVREVKEDSGSNAILFQIKLILMIF